ncbi:MAG TPA: PIG-L family deacetylase [Luteitalea sp.]|nr:PIG-L family deacetylase [Luteitalea sp.]
MSVIRTRLVAASFSTAVILAVIASYALAQSARSATRARTLLAVFAHPDDETIAGPLLARYGADGKTRVVLAIVTNGDKGATPFAGVPAGERLAAVRVKEAECSARALGADPPIMFGLPDGEMSRMPVFGQAMTKLRALLDETKPDAIVTWGPDGGYGHPDHRLVSALVTQVVQAGHTQAALYYAGLPKSGMDKAATTAMKFPAPFAPVVDEALNARVTYSRDDFARAGRSLACHASQFTPDTMKVLMDMTDQVNGGHMHLRSWNGGATRSDLFVR